MAEAVKKNFSVLSGDTILKQMEKEGRYKEEIFGVKH